MADKVASYHQARLIVEKLEHGMPTSPEGGEDDEYYAVPMASGFVQYDDCAWFVNKKTGKAERLFSAPFAPAGPGSMYYRDMKSVSDDE
ncbi:hypothetical protein G1C96_0146 [Bifidobacterium sp. DSM 109958]|uniref:Uncharacterized protein n=1 Tax=Bifidobacterium moraviense TaxID=2675323 RepID=A0A7Y0F0G9_9BIFI|nr:hypothetical protein [Bifidobacterium sp. DSM 109958]NMM99568.1 hypothetical protein [Bifidobacterium sp. DSM 109958]